MFSVSLNKTFSSFLPFIICHISSPIKHGYLYVSCLSTLIICYSSSLNIRKEENVLFNNAISVLTVICYVYGNLTLLLIHEYVKPLVIDIFSNPFWMYLQCRTLPGITTCCTLLPGTLLSRYVLAQSWCATVGILTGPNLASQIELF